MRGSTVPCKVAWRRTRRQHVAGRRGAGGVQGFGCMGGMRRGAGDPAVLGVMCGHFAVSAILCLPAPACCCSVILLQLVPSGSKFLLYADLVYCL